MKVRSGISFISVPPGKTRGIGPDEFTRVTEVTYLGQPRNPDGAEAHAPG